MSWAESRQRAMRSEPQLPRAGMQAGLDVVDALPDVEALPDTATGFVCLRPAVSTGRAVEASAAALWQAGVNAGVIGARHAPLQLQEGQSLLRLTLHASTTSDEIVRATSVLQASLEQGPP